MLLATTVELFDGLAATGPARPGPPRRDRRHRDATTPCTRTPTCWSSAPVRRACRRADRGAVRCPGRAGRRAERGRRRAARQHRHASTARPRWTGSRPPSPNSPTYPDVRAPAAHHRVRALRRRLRPGAGAPHRPPRRDAPAARQPPAGVAHPRPARPGRHRRPRTSRRVHRQRPARHHARRTAPARSCTATASGSARRPSCSPPTTAPTSPRSTCRRGRAGSTPIVDARDRGAAGPAGANASARGISLRPGAGRHAAPAATSASPTRSSPSVDGTAVLACDVLLVSGGWNPAVHLFSQARGTLRYDDALGAFVPGEPLDGRRRRRRRRRGLRPAGLPARAAARRPLPRLVRGLGFARRGRPAGRIRARDPVRDGRCARWCCGTCPTPGRRQANSSTCSATPPSPTWPARSAPACGRWNTSSATPPSAPRTTRARPPGSSPRASPPSCSGTPIEDLGTTTFRPPYTPVAFAALAGRSRGSLFDPERVTAVHDWHVAPRRGVRGRRPVEAAALLPAARRGHGRRGAARMCRRPRRRRHPRRFDARQDRRPGPGRRRVCSTCSTRT